MIKRKKEEANEIYCRKKTKLMIRRVKGIVTVCLMNEYLAEVGIQVTVRVMNE